MTQEKMNEYFKSEAGLQYKTVYTTSDDRIHTKYEDALKHREGELDENTKPLADKTITQWFEKEV